MGTNECSQPASKSSWDSQDFGDVNMVLKMANFDKSSRPQWVKFNIQIIRFAKFGWHLDFIVRNWNTLRYKSCYYLKES